MLSTLEDERLAVKGEPTRRGRSTTLLVMLILALTALPFLPALRYGFVWDDDVQVVGTVAARGAQSAKDYFLTSVWALRHSAVPLNYNYYRPLFASWLRINAALFGFHAFSWHLSALCIHLAVTALVFLLVRRHLQNDWAAVAGSLVFGLHPVHIESVVWISGVTDPLAALGILGGFLFWLRKVETPRAGLLAASLACYAAALASKETAVVLPGLVFAYTALGIYSEKAPPDSSRRLKIALRETAPFLGITLLYFSVRIAVLRSFRAGAPPWLPRSQVLLTAPSVFLFYLRHLIWPAGLRLFYDFAPVASLRSWRFWIPLALLAAGCVALARLRKRSDIIPAAAAWVVLPLVPVLNIGGLYRDDFLHDRYLYLPSIGLALLCGWAAQKIFGPNPQSLRRTGALAGFTLLFSCLAASTAIQSLPWRNNLSLYSTVSEHSTNTMARTNLASEYAQQGRFDDAQKILTAAVQERPDLWEANYNLGYVYYKQNRLGPAEEFLRKAIAINPGEADAYTYLGLTLFRENQVDEAASQLSAAIARNPKGEGYHFALGVIRKQQGQDAAAHAEFEKELENQPGNGLLRMRIAALEHDPAAAKNQPSAQARN